MEALCTHHQVCKLGALRPEGATPLRAVLLQSSSYSEKAATVGLIGYRIRILLRELVSGYLRSTLGNSFSAAYGFQKLKQEVTQSELALQNKLSEASSAPLTWFCLLRDCSGLVCF